MNILIAEDEADLRRLLRMGLEGEGYRVFAACDGAEAWEIVQTQALDLAILDVRMPRMDGFHLLKKIRKTSTLPVIFLTARAEEVDKVLGLEMGADDYLAKPFSMNELLARVGAQLRRSHQYLGSAAPGGDVIAYGALRLDRTGCCAYRDGKPLALNAKEFKLLRFLMEHPEQVFTKRQLYDAVWDDPYLGDDNTVMVHISHLRTKIEADPQNPAYIRTIRGLGYKLHWAGKTP